MLRLLPIQPLLIVFLSFALLSARVFSQDALPATEIIVSVAEQQMALIRSGQLVARYPISTSKFGLGDARNSYRTPLGRMRICEKIGDNLVAGTVLKGREATREVLPVNAPGRDPIVTRILWLEGLEEQNRNARSRAIYIHGTPEESRLGEPVSWGCVRMRSRDIIALYDQVEVGTPVSIILERLPKLRSFDPSREIIVVSNKTFSPGSESGTSFSQALSAPANSRDILSEIAGSSGTRNLSGKAGAMDAMKGSILFSGISENRESVQ